MTLVDTDRPARLDTPLAMAATACAVCDRVEAEPVAVGEDFEYRTSPDTFLAVRCPSCRTVRLDPRPDEVELTRIYPDDYHAFDFSADEFGIVHRVRRRLESRRLLRATTGLPAGARVLDVGCGDGFHLELLRDGGAPGWALEGIDLDERAVERARRRGLTAHHGSVTDDELDEAAYDLVLLIQTIEHVADPTAVLRSIRRVLRPGGRLAVVTDNTGSPDFRLAGARHWGGYHFPRHWHLFDRTSLALLAHRTGLEVELMSTMTSPVNWTYSVRNLLDDYGAPRRVVSQFDLRRPVPLGVFTVLDRLLTAAGRGALLRAHLRRPA
jgi:2-polyprenyl-3-methyl-5-hydroxy-6-metoxy-1,4-benzoquinol methylase